MIGSGKGEVTFGGGWARAARALEVGVVALCARGEFCKVSVGDVSVRGAP